MRRALLAESDLAALRERCIDLGVRVIVRTDPAGDCRVELGERSFDELDDAVAHVEQMVAP